MGQKIETLFANWGVERNLAGGEPRHVLDSIDAFYQPYTHRYMRKRNILQQYLEQYEDEMYGTDPHEASMEEQEMPPPMSTSKRVEEPTSKHIPVLTSTSGSPIQSTSLPLTTNTTFDSREDILRESTQPWNLGPLL